jgi:[NiFe] hydrogenase assembly HybE family chaperone
LRTGDSISFAFPSANYEFLKNTEAELTYYSCSLFSPMFEFETQEQARTVAVSVLELLFQAPQVAAPAVAAPTTLSRRNLLRGKLYQE